MQHRRRQMIFQAAKQRAFSSKTPLPAATAQTTAAK